MLDSKLRDEIAAKFAALLAASPAKDIEKNFRALIASTLARLDLVTREEFDVQRDLLAKTRERMTAFESRLAELEGKLGRDR
jgi:ubiquinone biosynthesis accessory factor UbiK